MPRSQRPPYGRLCNSLCYQTLARTSAWKWPKMTPRESPWEPFPGRFRGPFRRFFQRPLRRRFGERPRRPPWGRLARPFEDAPAHRFARRLAIRRSWRLAKRFRRRLPKGLPALFAERSRRWLLVRLARGHSLGQSGDSPGEGDTSAERREERVACRKRGQSLGAAHRIRRGTVPVFGGGEPSMFNSLEVEVLIQPDGGEGLAKRKGTVVRQCLNEAWSKCASRWTRTE